MKYAQLWGGGIRTLAWMDPSLVRRSWNLSPTLVLGGKKGFVFYETFFTPFLACIARISVFNSQIALPMIPLIYLSRNKSPISRVTPSH